MATKLKSSTNTENFNTVNGTVTATPAAAPQAVTPTVSAPTYTVSQQTTDLYNQLQSILSNTPTLDTTGENYMNQAYQNILNKKDFSYDFNADPLYQQYKEQYTTQGKIAANNAAAATATLTGGYGNSYATTAAAQANQQYLTQLNNVIPELYNAALEKYQNEVDDLYNTFNAASSIADYDLDKYSTDSSNYYNNANLYSNLYENSVDQDNDAYERAYNLYRDNVSDSQWQSDYNYQTYRDSVSDAQNSRDYSYQTSRDAVADAQWQAEQDEAKREYDKDYALSLKQLAASKASSSNSSSKSSSSSSKKSSSSGTSTSKTTGTTKTATATTSDLKSAEAYVNSNHTKTEKQTYIKNLLSKGKISKAQAQILIKKIGSSK